MSNPTTASSAASATSAATAGAAKAGPNGSAAASAQLLALAESHQWSKLFIVGLHWGSKDTNPVSISCSDGVTRVVTNVSTYVGIRVWVCAERPGAAIEAEIDRELAKKSTDRIVIFYNDTEQVWRWPVRRQVGNSVTFRLTSHRHRTGQPNPRFLARIGVITMPTDRQLDANTVVAKIRAAFDVETENETKYASKLMARLYAAMEKAYPPATPVATRDHEISLTLARLLFLMFGDDTEMWATDAFRDYIHTRTDSSGAGLSAQLDLLFTHLDTAQPVPGPDTPSGFKYVNGGIFAERVALPELGKEFRDVILEACVVDWSTISPAIFGSMFQSVRDAVTRRKLGEHYTSETNILKTLNPLFLDELRTSYAAAVARDTTTKQVNALNALWKRLGDVRFMDPACGCGNFIIVAYRELRDLELSVMEALLDRQHGQDQQTLGGELVKALRVTLDHFFGIEIDEWPARIAETAMYLIDRQCDLKLRERFGEAPERLPIQTQTVIVSGVSALGYDWSQLTAPTEHVVVAGNPPFLGISLRSDEQTKELSAVWGTSYHGTLDYVTGWYAKAMVYFGDVAGRWAFVSTSSVTQGEAVAPLFDALYATGWRIAFAHRTFRWTSEATGQAAVHCVIIGFDRSPAGGNPLPRLFDYPHLGAAPVERLETTGITPYLTEGSPVIVRSAGKPLNPQLGEVSYGNKPTDGGHLIVEPDEYDQVMADLVAAKYVHPLVGARELLHAEERWCLWLTDMKPEDYQASPVLQQRVAEVANFRLASKAATTRAAAKDGHLFRQISQPAEAYLCIPRHVSETRPYFLAARFSADVIASDANFIAPDPDGFMFAVISSTMFITWQRTVGGRLKSDLRFNKLLTWNTFPLPQLKDQQRQALIDAGQRILDARALQKDLSLAEQYEPGRLTLQLREAHEGLDGTFDAIFGFDPKLDLLARQDTLFARYKKITAARKVSQGDN